MHYNAIIQYSILLVKIDPRKYVVRVDSRVIELQRAITEIVETVVEIDPQ